MIYVRQMPDGSESIELFSFPVRIREFVNSVRERDPEKCSLFGSTSDHKDLNDQIGQVSLVDQKVPEDSEDRGSFEAERRKGNQVECENENSADNAKQNLLILSLPEQNVPEDTVAPETSEQQRKHKGKEVAYENSENSAANEIQNSLVLYVPERYAPENAENVEAPRTSGIDNQLNGKEVVVYENPAELQLVVYKGNHTPAEIDAAPDSDYDTSRTISDLPTESRNIYRRRHEENVNKAAKNKNNLEKKPKFFREQTFRVLSDLNTELEDENVEIRFPDYFVDDITRISSKNRKAEKSNLKNNKKNTKKHKALKTKESPRFVEAEPSNRGAVNHKVCTEPCGSGLAVGRVSRAKPTNLGLANRKESSEPCGSGSMVGRVRRAKPSNHGPANRKRSSGPSDSRLAVGRVKRAKSLKRGSKRLKPDNEEEGRLEEAARILLYLGKEILKPVTCKGLDECNGCEPSGSQSLVANEVNGSRDEMEMVQTREAESEDLVCTLNQNPTDFSTEVAKMFMRRI